jgi:hypothetical protein
MNKALKYALPTSKVFARNQIANIGLALIIVIGSVLRLTGLTTQSMWLDELHTMVECNPDTSLGEMYHYLWTGMDPHPPLYFTTTYFWFKVFGHNDFNARLVAAVFGVLSIYAMYLLGKELHNRSAGIIAALLTSINYYNIYYSQEARNYSCAFLFAALSFYGLVRLLRNPNIRTSLFYGITTTLVLYSHYYGMIVLAAQLFILLLFLIADADNRKKLFLQSLLAGGVILVLFAPWIKPVLLQMDRDSIWISRPEGDFFLAYFGRYFGGVPVLIYLFAFILLFYLIKAFLVNSGNATPREYLFAPLNFSFFILFLWVTLTYLLPYVRSLIGLPMLYDRYTIVTLPALLMAIAIGIELINNPFMKWMLVLLIVTATLVDLRLNKDYYRHPHKQNWRELTEFVVSNNAGHYPIISDRQWHASYYFGQHDFKPTYLPPDSVRQYAGRGIWIMTGHSGEPINAQTFQYLDSTYTLAKEYKGIDTWAKLYKKMGVPLALLNGTPFADGTYVMWGNAAIETESRPLAKGTYELNITAYGSAALEQSAHVNVYLNEKKVGQYFLPESLATHDIYLKVPQDLPSAKVRIEFDNDNMDPATGRDRNAFIKSVHIGAISPALQ